MTARESHHAADWELRRNEFKNKAIELEFGGMPPEPEVLEIEALHFCGSGLKRAFRIYTGTKEHQLSFTLSVYRPLIDGKRPVLLTGDGCYDNLNDEVIAEALKRGFAIRNCPRNLHWIRTPIWSLWGLRVNNGFAKKK